MKWTEFVVGKAYRHLPNALSPDYGPEPFVPTLVRQHAISFAPRKGEESGWCWCPDDDGNFPFEPILRREHDVVAKPRHYDVVPGFEVKDINKAILDSMEAEGFDITLYEAGWWQQSMQYFMRAHKKNGLEDLKKGIQTMQFVVDSMEKRYAESVGETS